MKFLVFSMLLFCFDLLSGQSSKYDSVNFFNQDAFSIRLDHSIRSKGVSQEFISRNSDLRKIQFFDSKGRVAREEFYENELTEEIVFSYFEKDQVIKRYDVLNKLELSCRLSVHFNYPPLARESEIEGEILVEFTLNDACIPTHFKVLNSLGYEIDKEVNTKVKRMIDLSKKYNLPYIDCGEDRKPLKIIFSLNE